MNKNSIAFLTRSLIDATGKNMWKGIVSGCQKDSIPLITFRGPVLNKGQGSIIYHLLNDDSVSGIISWASSDVDQATFDYYKKFQKTPLVCMTFRIEGTPLIVTDCKSGEIELINHLIEVHKFNKIAFIRGPETHVYAKERYEGYLEALKNHNIPFNEDLVSSFGGWAVSDGAKAIDNWLNNGLKPGIDIEAVVAVGDNVAIGAQEQLIKKGYSVPHDIAVCGFNGTDDAAWSNPPITTVEMPFYGQGIQGYNTLKAILNNEPFEQEFKYSTRLVLGESCGCSSASVKKAYFSDGSTINDKPLKPSIFHKTAVLSGFEENAIKTRFNNPSWQENLKNKILETVNNDRYSKMETIDFFSSYSPRLVSSFVKECFDSDSKSVFSHTISKGLNKFLKLSNEFSVWQDIISIIRSIVLSSIGGYNQFYKKAENLFQQARVLINEVDCRTQKQINLLEHRKESTLRQITTEILSCSDLKKLLDIIEKLLPKLEIYGCYISLYQNCQYTEENHLVPEKSNLILAVKNGERLDLPEDGLEFDTTQIIPDSICGNDDRGIYEVESLHYGDKHLGFIVFESSIDNGSVYSTLRDQISSSLYNALLLEERNKSRLAMEATMQTMAEKSEIVSTQTEGISSNISSISKSMDSVAENIKNISSNIGNVASSVETANNMISEADTQILNLVESTEQIINAVHMINDIAETTNVLALNAAIEAAHAGDAGRGFSVVAKEVKTLAAQTVASTQSIQELVQKNNENTKQVEEVIRATNKAIKTISALSEEIKASINEQVHSSTQVSQELQEASSGAEQVSSAITEIAKLGENFKI